MRAVRTILLISLLFLAATIVADKTESSNDLPDEIKNLDEKQMIKADNFHQPYYPTVAYKERIEADVWIRLKVGKDGRADTAEVVYCEKPDYGFEQSALNTVLKSRYPVRTKRRKVIRDWFFAGISFVIDTDEWLLGDISDIPTFFAEDSSFGIICPDSLVSIPEITEKAIPKYPRKALRATMGGMVTIRILIDRAGRPSRPEIIESTDSKGTYGFNEAVLSVVEKCRFKPFTCNNVPELCWFVFPYEFILQEKR